MKKRAEEQHAEIMQNNQDDQTAAKKAQKLADRKDRDEKQNALLKDMANARAQAMRSQ